MKVEKIVTLEKWQGENIFFWYWVVDYKEDDIVEFTLKQHVIQSIINVGIKRIDTTIK
jgi:hypothetical protein